MGGMDKIVNKDVLGTVTAIRQDPFATKVIVSLFILNGLVNKYVNILKSII